VTRLELRLASLAMEALKMPRFRHVCAPCDACGSGDPTCETCGGESRPCECQERWYEEGERRYDSWKSGDYDRD
jgi:hypothetical protein